MNNTVYPFILFGTALLMLLSLSLIFFVVYYNRRQQISEIQLKNEKQAADLEFQKQLLQNSLDVQEQERRRLAKDLHDEVGAILSALKMNNNQLSKELSNKELLFTNNKELIDESIQLIRNISRDLVPQTLENFGLIIAIQEFFNKLGKNTNIEFNFESKNFGPEIRFSTKIELLLYRIIQELSSNAIKHSNASKINLILNLNKNSLYFIFEDNGRGFDIENAFSNPSGGLGLRNIESRLSIVDGELKFNSEIGIGSSLEIWINDLIIRHEKN